VQPVEHRLCCHSAGGDSQKVVNQTKQDRFWPLPGRLGLLVDATPLIAPRSLMMIMLLLLLIIDDSLLM
jgi:hypothetical protein